VGGHHDDHGGYGDRYPVTAAGRLVAFGLMIGGIALLGTVTAILASWLVETVAAEKEQAEDLQITVRRLEDKIDQLAAEKKSAWTKLTAVKSHSAPNLRFRSES
jgi:voltage-gated potassium channel